MLRFPTGLMRKILRISGHRKAGYIWPWSLIYAPEKLLVGAWGQMKAHWFVMLSLWRWQRRPASGLIVHSDRGSQYASASYRRLLKGHGFVGNMSRKGDCWDNSVVESFFGSLKQELVHWKHNQSRYQAQQDILRYITTFITQSDCIRIWVTKVQISMKRI